jgi:thymidine phosphorylase
MIAGRAKDFDEGIELANQSIDSGEAFNKLERLIEFTNAERRYLRNEYEVEMEKESQGHFRNL